MRNRQLKALSGNPLCGNSDPKKEVSNGVKAKSRVTRNSVVFALYLAAFSQFRKTINSIPCMGYTMRTDKFRYTEWRNRKNMARAVARELYDHRQDNDENENVADNVEHAKLVKELASCLPRTN